MTPAHASYGTARAPVTAALALAASILLLGAAQALALPDDANQPIEIDAERAEMDRNAGTVTYTGSVKAQQGTMQVTADRMTIQVEDQKVVRITAEGGPARYQQLLEADKGLVKANARTIVYHTREEQVDLRGGAFLEQGGTAIRGELIHYDVVAGKANAESGDQEPVHVIVQPASRPE